MTPLEFEGGHGQSADATPRMNVWAEGLAPAPAFREKVEEGPEAASMASRRSLTREESRGIWLGAAWAHR